jgi:hypothetical protein
VADKNHELDVLDFDEANAAALADMLADPVTSENIRLQIINEILDQSKGDTFFETMYTEAMSFAECPFCHFETHWLIPEDDLNTIGWVSSEKDKRVKNHTTKDDCAEFMESCSKKKTTA